MLYLLKIYVKNVRVLCFLYMLVCSKWHKGEYLAVKNNKIVGEPVKILAYEL